MDRLELHSAILQDIADRTDWDQRQSTFYEMRHHGLRRQRKPWLGASDVHIPVGDMAIERLKPYYFQQLFATDLLANFVPSTDQQVEYTTAAAQWFDFQLKQHSNLEVEVLTAIDHLLVNGIGMLKVRWDVGKKQLVFDAVDPQHIIVPSWTKDIESADRVVHVQNYSLEGFKRAGFLVKDPAQLLGDPGTEIGDFQKAHQKVKREGLTWAKTGRIIVWEVWTQGEDGWEVETFCPGNPAIDLKEKHANPYDMLDQPPFVQLVYEVKDAGFYSSRGVMEQIAVFEVECTRLQNEKNDCMTLYNRPLFKAGREVPNSANMRFKPGSILPFDIAPIPMPQPPISFDIQMASMRDMAQQRVTTPDFGISTVAAGQGGSRRTATEIQAISGLHQQSSDLRMRVFRHGLGKLYKAAWSLLLQYAKEDLQFWYIDTVQEIPKEALHEKYGIVPSGSADGVNKPLMVQKVFQRYQLLSQNPFIDLGELTKSVLEADDATLVKRLFRDPGIRQQDQTEDQALEIAILKLGFPAAIRPTDEHAVHIQTILQYMQERIKTGAQIEPLEAKALEGHLAQHVEALSEVDKPMAKQAMDAIAVVGELINNADQQAEDPAGAVQTDPAIPAETGMGQGGYT